MEKSVLNSFHLKLIAVLSMLIDHVGIAFFPGVSAFRAVGRLAFPIFAFLLAEGFFHTSNKFKYLTRLLCFALISEVPYDLLLYRSSYYTKSQNVMFTLFIGFVAMMCIDILISKGTAGIAASVVVSGVFCLIAEMTHGDYGWYGILLILSFYFMRNKRIYALLSFSAMNTVYTIYRVFSLQHFALFSSVPLLLYNGKKGKCSLKYFFYIFYPAHLLLIYLIKTVIL